MTISRDLDPGMVAIGDSGGPLSFHRRSCLVEGKALKRLVDLDSRSFGAAQALAQRSGASVGDVLLATFVQLLHRYSGEGNITAFVRGCDAPVTLEVDDDSALVDAIHAIARMGVVVNPTGTLEARVPTAVGGSFGFRAWWDEYRATIEFTADDVLLDGASVDRACCHLQQLLLGAAETPGSDVHEMCYLTEAEMEAQALLGRGPQLEIPAGTSLRSMIDGVASRMPDALAVAAGEAQLSYRTVCDRSDQIAVGLMELGAGSGTRVAVCMPRSADLILAILGVLKAGAAYVPLDPLLYPLERLKFIVDDSGAELLITSGDMVDDWKKEFDAVVTNDELSGSVGMAAQLPVPDLEDPAYVMYTSGSTGQPKGVTVLHRGLVSMALHMAPIVVPRPEEARVLQFAPVSFDISVGDLLLSLTTGASLHIAPDDALLSGDQLADFIRAEGITNIQVSPSVLAGIPDSALPDLTTIVLGAEECPPELVRRWSPGRRVFNCYGPTEATICATYWPCSDEHTDRVPIGTPLPNVRLHVLDKWGSVVPQGIAGELYISGIGVARGYLGQPDLTGRSFITGINGESSSYRTGDLVRFRSDGLLEFLGRCDQQVKLRGYRVELGEVEAAATTHPSVRAAAADIRESARGIQLLVVYLIPDSPGLSISDPRATI